MARSGKSNVIIPRIVKLLERVVKIVFVCGFLKNASASNIFIVSVPEALKIKYGFVPIFNEWTEWRIGNCNAYAIAVTVSCCVIVKVVFSLVFKNVAKLKLFVVPSAALALNNYGVRAWNVYEIRIFNGSYFLLYIIFFHF